MQPPWLRSYSPSSIGCQNEHIQLALTDQPIGRLLRDHGVQVTRELCAWGLIPAGSRAARLGPRLTSASRVPGRTYVMRLTATKMPLAVLTERFSPHVFEGASGG
jgi:chorismate-pyruvate lyase